MKKFNEWLNIKENLNPKVLKSYLGDFKLMSKSNPEAAKVIQSIENNFENITPDLQKAIIDAGESGNLQILINAYNKSNQNNPNQKQSDLFSQKPKREALKKLANAVLNGSGFQVADMSHRLAGLKGSQELSNFFHYLTKTTTETPEGKMTPSDFLNGIIDPSNFKWLQNPKNFSIAINLAYQAIQKYQTLFDSIDDPKIKKQAQGNLDPMIVAYKEILALNK
jgi:hypothetical protein